MSGYISREAVIKALCERSEPCFTESGEPTFKGDYIGAIASVPAADVRSVVRAAWQSWEQDKPPFKWYSCDYCGFHALSRSNYCPNCGAKMDGGGKE